VAVKAAQQDAELIPGNIHLIGWTLMKKLLAAKMVVKTK